MNSVSLSGPCNGPIEFQNSGILKAPLGLQGNTWIEFRYIHGLTLSGGGTFDGQGRPKQGSPDLPTVSCISTLFFISLLHDVFSSPDF